MPVELVAYPVPVICFVSPVMGQNFFFHPYAHGNSFSQEGVHVTASTDSLEANTDTSDSIASVEAGTRHEAPAQWLKRRRRYRHNRHARVVGTWEAQQPSTSEEHPMFPAATCRELIHKLELGGDHKSNAMISMKDWILDLAYDSAGCRVVQEALKIASKSEASEIANELRFHIRDVAVCKNGNYVVQKLVEMLPPSRFEFVVEELRDVSLEMACHPYACRILCRLLEHCAAAPQTISLINDLLKHAHQLLHNMYGHYVLELTLEHGSHEQRSRIVRVILSQLVSCALQCYSSHVLIMALRFCGDNDREALVDGLLESRSLASLAMDKRGHKVVQELLEVPEQDANSVVAQLRPWVNHLEQSNCGRHVLKVLQSRQSL